MKTYTYIHLYALLVLLNTFPVSCIQHAPYSNFIIIIIALETMNNDVVGK
jgi:hypothetical protein